MGVEYRQVLVPRDNTVRPDPDTLRRLLAALRANAFISDGLTIRTAEAEDEATISNLSLRADGELILIWRVEDHLAEKLNYPLTPEFKADGFGGYYDFELLLSDDFVAEDGELIDPISTVCVCGHDLAYEPDEDIFYAGRIRRVCPICVTAYRPQDHETIIRDGFTGEESAIAGGLTYRFAISINCGKCWDQNATKNPAADQSLLALCEEVVGVKFCSINLFW